MKKSRFRNIRSMRHHQEIAALDEAARCPIEGGCSPYNQGNFGIWLRLQALRLEHRLVCWDMVVFLAFVLFMVAATRLNNFFASYQLVPILTLLLAVGCCVAFIGVHFLAHRSKKYRLQSDYSQPLAWQRYQHDLQTVRPRIRRYAAAVLAGLALLLVCEVNDQPLVVACGMPLYAALFMYGIRTIRLIIGMQDKTVWYLRRLKLLDADAYRACVRAGKSGPRKGEA